MRWQGEEEVKGRNTGERWDGRGREAEREPAAALPSPPMTLASPDARPRYEVEATRGPESSPKEGSVCGFWAQDTELGLQGGGRCPRC